MSLACLTCNSAENIPNDSLIKYLWEPCSGTSVSAACRHERVTQTLRYRCRSGVRPELWVGGQQLVSVRVPRGGHAVTTHSLCRCHRNTARFVSAGSVLPLCCRVLSRSPHARVWDASTCWPVLSRRVCSCFAAGCRVLWPFSCIIVSFLP